MARTARAVTVIPSTINPLTRMAVTSVAKRRVAGYARVSTDSDEQFTSYEAQITACLGVLIGADTAVGAHAQFLLRLACFQVALGWNDLHLSLGSIGIGITNCVLCGLSLFICTAAWP